MIDYGRGEIDWIWYLVQIKSKEEKRIEKYQDFSQGRWWYMQQDANIETDFNRVCLKH